MRRENDTDRNVISMNRFVDKERYPLLAEVEAYWDGLRGARPVPMRSEVDPRGIERALEYAFILERIAPGVARLRIAGSHLTDLMGMEVRGMPITAFFTPDARKTVTTMLEDVFSGPTIGEVTLSADKGIGKPAMDAKMLLLPMTSDMGDVSRILGCFVTNGQIGRTPRRFNVTETKLREITNREAQPFASAPTRKSPVKPLKVSGFAETSKPFARNEPPKTQPTEPKPVSKPSLPPYLRLVESE